MNAVVEFTNRLVREDDGQDLVEYVLIFGLVSIVAIPVLITFGPVILDFWASSAGIIADAF